MTAVAERRAGLLSLVRDPSIEALRVQCDPSATLCLDVRSTGLDEGGEDLVLLLRGLQPAQRAGLVARGHADRTVLVAPAVTGRPSTRALFLFSHPDAGAVTEIVAYTDGTPLDGYPDGELPAPAHRLAQTPRRTETADPARRALVTASSSALGRVIAATLLAAGIPTAFQGVRPEVDLPAAPDGVPVVYLPGDASDPATAERLVADAAAALGGPVTVLVNNLGPWDATPLSAAASGAWTAAVEQHAGAALRLAQLVAPGMRELGWGRIVNISASSARTRDHGLYGFGKAMLEELTETLALELAPAVTVNAIAPGQIEESIPVMAELDPAAVPEMVRRTPAGRVAARPPVARLVLALLEPGFDLLTGAVIPLDGGYRIPRNR